MQRYDIIKYLIRKHDFKSYLEIGVLGGETFEQIDVLVKHGVDPNGRGTHTMTSDEFFLNHCKRSYDLIFIDGLHLAEQVKRDIENSLTHLNQNGIIMCHDILPTEEWHQLREGIPGKPWTGDCWKALADIRSTRLDLKIRVVDTDWGCGLIERTTDPVSRFAVHNIPWDWEIFQASKKQILNVITVEEFLNG